MGSVHWIISLILALLSVTGSLGLVEIETASDTLNVLNGEFVTLKCKSSTSALDWIVDDPMFGEITVDEDSTSSLIVTNAITGSGHVSLLSIEGVVPEDATTYICRSRDNPGDEDQVRLLINDENTGTKPSDWVALAFERTSQALVLEVEVEKELSLTCTGGNVESELQFLFNGNPIPENVHNVVTSAFDLDTVKQKAILTRAHADMSHSGIYTCLDTTYQDETDTIEVRVVSHPSTQVEITEPSGSSAKVMEGRSFSLTCQADLGAHLVWRHNDQTLQDGDNSYQITVVTDVSEGVKRSLLTKEDTNVADAGQYSCSNDNSPGDIAEILIEVKVDGEVEDGNGGARGVGVTSLSALVLAVVFAFL